MEQLAYDEQYMRWKEWDPSSFGQLDEYFSDYYDLELSSRLPREGIKLIDVGFGNGAILTYAKKRGWRATGIEINDRLLETARSAGFLAFDNLQCLEDDGNYDLITAFDVLEHLSNDQITSMLAEVRRLLSDSGIFVARFPNGDSPLGRIYQHADVTHVSTIGMGKVSYYCSSAGLKLDYIGRPAKTKSKTFMGAMRQKAALLARNMLERTIAELYFGGSSVPFCINYLVVLSKSSVPAAQ